MKMLFTYMILFAMTFMVLNPLGVFNPNNSNMVELAEEEHTPKGAGKDINFFPFISADVKHRAISHFNALQNQRFAQYTHFPIDEDHSMAVYLPPDLA